MTFRSNSALKLTGLAIAIAAPAATASAETIFGLAGGNIVTFDSATPGTVNSSRAITGLASGERLVGLDLRPATKTLYSVSTSGNLYTLARGAGGTYVATSIGIIAPPPTGSNFGIDFNPVPDRLRLISDTNQNLRINPTNAVTLVDTPITLNGSSTVDIIGSAYANNRAGALTTRLYGLDAITDSLLVATNANAGTYINVGALGVALGSLDRVGFDISGRTNNAFFSVRNSLYSLNLGTGTGTLIGNVGAEGLAGITAAGVPEPASWAMLIAGFGLVGASMRRRTAALART
ncbi:lipoprotein [Polymorphobacter glacialis]|uniref:Lipoprotein n=1 Tax=Sandarakinorhabdus glacialis TaxID=1614636 RepID=A0A917E620_9SPHN|nr:DUF4394 domain-containing protein [Polymorphobacter glacialis]GGE08224.1 lipoprotein [Polymorphobacter glacialis]